MKKKIATALLIALPILAQAAPEHTVRRYCTEQERALTTPTAQGYCLFSWWIPGMVSRSSYYMTPPQNFKTRWLYQDPGLIEETAAMGSYDGTEDYIALMSPSALGWKAFLWHPETEQWVPVRVVDSVKREHEWYHVVLQNSGGELSYDLAERFNNIDWVNEDGSRYRTLTLCITDFHPEQQCSTNPELDFEAWFVNHLTWEPVEK